jgi:hypothetical protein
MNTTSRGNKFVVEAVTAINDTLVHLYGHSTLTGHYMRCSFVARTSDDAAFVSQFAHEVGKRTTMGDGVPLEAEYDDATDEFWVNYKGWTFKISRFFDWH